MRIHPFSVDKCRDLDTYMDENHMGKCGGIFFWVFPVLSEERFEVSGWMRTAEGNICSGRQGWSWS